MTTYTVTSGQTKTGLALNYSDILNINSGGIVNGTVVSSGGTAYISKGGITNNTEVNSNGAEAISGGIANGTVVNSGGSEYITSGGIASSTVINNGGSEYIYSGGIAKGTVVNSGGSENIHLGGIASGIIVNSGGHLWIELDSYISKSSSNAESVIKGVTLHSGARLLMQLNAGANLDIDSKDIYTAITLNGGTDNILSGGIVRRSIVNSGGGEHIHLGGIASSTIINNGGSESVYLGGIASRTMVNSGGSLSIHSGGIANGSTVNSGGKLWLELSSELSKTGSDGEYIINGVTLHSGAKLAIQLDAGANLNINSGDIYSAITIKGGTENILSNGIVTGTIINNGGVESIYSGGIASNTVVNSGTQYIHSGGKASGTIVSSGATVHLSSGGEANNSVVNSGGNLSLDLRLTADIKKTGSNAEYIVNNVTLHSGAKLSLELDPSISLGVYSKGEYIINRTHGSTESINLKGIQKSTVINGGTETVYAGGIVSGSLINSGGTENVMSGGVVSGTVVNSGTENILSGGTAVGTIVNNGGELHFVKSAIINSLTLNSGAKLNFLNVNVTSASVNKLNQLVLTSGDVILQKIGLKGDYSNIEFVTHNDSKSGTLITELNLTGSVADFLANQSLISNSARYVIKDFDFNIANNLDALKANIAKIKSISINHFNNPLAITEAQFTRDADVISLIGSYKVTVNNVIAADAAKIAAHTYVALLSVTDSATNIAAKLNTLQSLNNKLTSITASDAVPTVINLTAAQYKSMYNMKFNNFTAAVSGITTATAAIAQTDSKVTQFNVVDTTNNIISYLSALRADTKLTSITLSDSPTALSITPKQSFTYHNVLAKISDHYHLIITGTNTADKLYDTIKSHATLTGGDGIDTFNVTGTDTITDLGNGGADILKIATGATVNTTIISPWTANIDTINYSTVSITTPGLAVNLSAVIKGTSGYKITNTGQGTLLTGSAFGDLIIGGAGSDTIAGGMGNDTLTGGAGVDYFIFNTLPNYGSHYNNYNYYYNYYNVDSITDFVSGKDHLQFSKSIFTGLFTVAGNGNGNKLMASEFVSSPIATHGITTSSHLIYNNLSGALYYDADGNGSDVAIKVAILGTATHPALAASDIFIIT